MKLRNKRTGEVGYLEADNSAQKVRVLNQFNDTIAEYNSLADIENEWESYEEPKLRWYVGSSGIVHKEKTTLYSEPREVIGNSFETEREAEKAVEKMKAWKRLKDGGAVFFGYSVELPDYQVRPLPEITIRLLARNIDSADLDLLFGGKE